MDAMQIIDTQTEIIRRQNDIINRIASVFLQHETITNGIDQDTQGSIVCPGLSRRCPQLHPIEELQEIKRLKDSIFVT